MNLLNMPVRLYDGHHDIEPSRKPDWCGTLNEFWGANRDDIETWGEIRQIGELLQSSQRRWHCGGGAVAESTLFREDLHPEERTARGWDKVDGGAQLDWGLAPHEAAELALYQGHRAQNAELARANNDLAANYAAFRNEAEANEAELLAALKEAAGWIRAELGDRLPVEALANAEAAIAKAEGRA